MITKEKILANKARREAREKKLQAQYDVESDRQMSQLMESAGRAFMNLINATLDFDEGERRNPRPKPVQTCVEKPKNWVGPCSVNDILGK